MTTSIKTETRGRKPVADPVQTLGVSLPASQWAWVHSQPGNRSSVIRELVTKAQSRRKS